MTVHPPDVDVGTEGGRLPLDIAYACGALRVTTRGDSPSTGPRAHVTGFVGGLRSHGHRVRVMLAGDRVPARFRRIGDDTTTTASQSWRGRVVDAARIGLNPALGLWTRAGADRCDIFYERQATYQALGAFRPAGTPWVVESNGPFWYEADVERGALSYPVLAKRMELAAYRRADMVIAVSEALKDVLVDAAGLDPERVLVVPNAVDPQRFTDRATVRPSADGATTVGFVGHLIKWAGLVHLVEATAAARRRGADVRLIIAGDGPARAEVQESVRRHGLERHVELLGHRPWDEVPSVLGQCDVAFSGQLPMAIGSMYHSPLKLYEYSAAGLPVIATDFPDARELVVGSGAGWLVRPGDVDGLTETLVTAAGSREHLPSLGVDARAHVLQRHTWAHRAAAVVGELERRGLISGGRTS